MRIQGLDQHSANALDNIIGSNLCNAPAVVGIAGTI